MKNVDKFLVQIYDYYRRLPSLIIIYIFTFTNILTSYYRVFMNMNLLYSIDIFMYTLAYGYDVAAVATVMAIMVSK